MISTLWQEISSLIDCNGLLNKSKKSMRPIKRSLKKNNKIINDFDIKEKKVDWNYFLFKSQFFLLRIYHFYQIVILIHFALLTIQ